MAITVSCPVCFGKFETPEIAIGKQTHCPRCGADFKVIAPETLAPAAKKSRPSSPASGRPDPFAPRPGVPLGSMEDDEPTGPLAAIAGKARALAAALRKSLSAVTGKKPGPADKQGD
jgi:hypothetical protein